MILSNPLYVLGLIYHVKCESYDRLVCRKPDGSINFRNGVAVPCSDEQYADINRNANMIRTQIYTWLPNDEDERKLFRQAIKDIGRSNMTYEQMGDELRFFMEALDAKRTAFRGERLREIWDGPRQRGIGYKVD